MRCVAAALLFVALTACIREPRVYPDQLRTVGNVVGQRAGAAMKDLDAGGFLVRVVTPAGIEVDASRCPDAQVAAQNPAAGDRVVKATTVTLTVPRCP